MTPEERIRAAREFVALADQFFGAGNSMVGAEMLWGAVTQIVIGLTHLKPHARHSCESRNPEALW